MRVDAQELRRRLQDQAEREAIKGEHFPRARGRILTVAAQFQRGMVDQEARESMMTWVADPATVSSP